MRYLVETRRLVDRVEVDSAGTGAYHVGEPPDRRSAAAARRRGIRLSGRARQFVKADFERFDYVVAMDSRNHEHLAQLAGNAQHKLFLLRDFDPDSPKGASVPDPYYGGEDGFDEVVDLCLSGCGALLDHIEGQLGGGRGVRR